MPHSFRLPLATLSFLCLFFPLLAGAQQTAIALPYTMTTLAGSSPAPASSGQPCAVGSPYTTTDAFGDGCPAANAVFGTAAYSGVVADSFGNVFVSDDIKGVVHMINPITGIMTLVAGGNTACGSKLDSSGDGCVAATGTALTGQRGVGIDPYGNILVAGYNDHGVHLICRNASPLCGSVTPSANNPIQIAIGSMGLVAGCVYSGGSSGVSGVGVDNTPAFSTPTSTYSGSAFVNAGVSSSACSTSLGEVDQPRGVTGDSYGNIYYGDTTSERFRVVLGPQTYNGVTNPLWSILTLNAAWSTLRAGYVYTIAGLTTTATTAGSNSHCSGSSTPLATDAYGDGCLFTSASVFASTSDTQGGAVDAAGNLIWTDSGHGVLRVFLVSTSGTAGAAMVNAIKVNNSTLSPSTPQVGFVYSLAGGAGSSGAGISATPTLGNSTNALDSSTLKVTVSPQGNVFIGDKTRVLFYDINTGYIRTLFTSASSNVAAGSFCTGSSGPKSLSAYSDGCPASLAEFGDTTTSAMSVAADPQGNLYLFDGNSASAMLVRKVLAQGMTAQTLGTPLTQTFQTHLVGTNSSTATSTVASSTNADLSYGTPACTKNGDNTIDCTVTVTATSSAVGQRSAAMTVANASGNVNVALDATVSGSALAFDAVSTTTGGTTTPVAPTTTTVFSAITPASVAVDGAGNVYAASGSSVSSSAGGALSPALPATPSQIAVDQLGDIFAVNKATATISELAVSAAGAPGSYSLASIAYTCASCTAAPQAVAVDQASNLYVADFQSGGSSIYRLSLAGSTVLQQITVATGLTNPVSLAVDASGNVYVADKGAGKVYQYTPATSGVPTYAQSIKLSSVTPVAVAVDAAGDVYVQDAGSGNVFEVPASGPETIVLGNLVTPTGLAVDGLGNVYSADSSKTSITKVVRSAGSYGSTTVSETSIQGTLTNVGNLAATGITQSGNAVDFTLTPSGCTIGTSNSFAAGLACTIQATLTSTALQSYGSSFTETLSFLTTPTIGSVAFSNYVTIPAASPTVMTVTGPNNPLFAATGTEATYTVTVSGITSPSGTSISVTVKAVTTSGTPTVFTSAPTLNSSGQATVSLSGLAAGTYTISASYAGMTGVYTSSSASANFTIQQFVATGDSRTVTEPSFPAVCQSLAAALTSVSDDLPTSVDATVTNPDGARIQAALNSCASSNQAVELSVDGAGHNAFLTGPLSMPSGVTLLVDPGVYVYFSRNVQDYDTTPGTHTCGTVGSASATSSCKALIDIPGTSSNVGIMGFGKLDGRGGDTLINAISPYQGQSWWGLSSIANSGGTQENPRFIQIDSGASNITMYKITLRNSPLFHISTTGAATNFTAWDIKIITPTSSRNTDGIDPGNVTNFTVTRSWVSDGDDNIAVGGAGTTSPATNVTITNNHFFAGHGESIGSYTSSGVSNILFDSNMSSGNGTAGKGSSVNNTADSNSTGLRIKSGYDRGGVVQNVQYSNSCYQYHKAEIVFSPNYEATTGTSSPNLKNILMQNLTFLTEGTMQFTGTSNNSAILPLQVTLDNVSFFSATSADFSPAPTNAQLTYGPGGVSTNFITTYATFINANGNTVTNNVTETSLAPPTCNFTYIAPELTGPKGLPQTITAGDNATAIVILTPAVGGAAYPTGTVTLTDALTSNTTTVTLPGTTDTISIPLTGLSVGTHTFTMAYSGDSNYTGATPYSTAGPYVITVNAGTLTSTTTTLSGVPSTAPYGSSFTAQASVSGSSPSGTVEFIVNGSVYATAAVSAGSASASLTLPFSSSAYSVQAIYSGDSANAGSTSSTALVTITAAVTTTTLAANTTTTTLGHPVLLTATVTSGVGTPTGGTVSFTYTTTGNSTPVAIGSAATLINGQAFASAEFLPAGTDNVTATYSGSTDFGTSASSPATAVTINAPAIVALSSSPIALPYTITTIAGGSTATNANTTCSGSSDSNGDGCLATAITLNTGTAASNDLRAVAADPFGNVYFTDKNAKLVRRIAPNGVVYNFAGRVTGTACVPTATVGCTPTLVSLSGPRGISTDAQGNLYIADYNGNNVYQVKVSTGLLYLVAGIGVAGATTNGSVATSTNVNTPRGVWGDAVGNIYIADTGANQILVVDTAGYVHIFAGTGTAASNGDGGPALSAAVSNPQGVTTDVNLNVYIADSSGGRIRVVCVTCGTGSPLDALLGKLGITTPTNGYIYTIAGSSTAGAGTLPTSVTMTPQKLAMDNNSNIYISDSSTIWFVDFHTGYTRSIAKNGTVCGSAADSVGDGCPATQATLGDGASGGIGVATDTLGNIYISDTADDLIRKVNTNLALPPTATGSSTAQPLQIHFTAGDNQAASNAFAYTSTEWSLGTPSCTTNADTTTDCLVTSSFTPAVPGARSTPLTVTSSLGNTANLALSGIGLGAGSTLDPAQKSTFGANLAVAGLATDTAGNVYVSDSVSKKVLRFAPAALTQGSSASSTTVATLTAPGAVAVDPRGYVYVADTSTHLITQISPSGTASTLSVGLTFSAPAGLVVDPLNNLYVSDSGAAAVYQINPITGASRTLVTGTLVTPAGLAFDSNGNLLIADPGAPAIYRFSLQSGVRTTVSTSAVAPSAALPDAAGNLLIADTAAILAVPASSHSTGFAVASISPVALAIDSAGNLYTGSGGSVMKLTRTQGHFQFAAGASAQTINLMNSGNQALTLSSIGQTDSTDYGLAGNASTDCTLTSTLPSGLVIGGVCALTATYTPTTYLTTTDTATLNGNLANAALSTPPSVQLTLTGPSTPPTPTFVLNSFSTYVYGQTASISATVSNSAVTPTGSVVFTVDGNTSSASVVSGVATASLTGLSAGGHTVSAAYTSSNGFASATTSTSTLTILPAGLTITANNQSFAYGSTPPTFTVTLSGFQYSDTTATAVPCLGGVHPTCAPGFTFKSGTNVVTISSASPTGTYTIIPNAGTMTAANYTFNSCVVSAAPDSMRGETTCASITPDRLTKPQGLSTNTSSTYVNGTLTITPATLTVAAGSATVSYGTAIPSLGYTITGFLNGDTIAVVSGTPSVSTNAGPGSPAGNYSVAITQGSLSAANYIFSMVAGQVTITKVSTSLGITSITPGPSGPLGTTFVVAFLVQTALGGSPPTGTIGYTVDGGAVLSATLGPNGTAVGSFVGLAAGRHVISVNYNGDGNYLPTTPTSFSLTEGQITPTLNAALNTSVVPNVITFTLTPSIPTPTGTISCSLDGGAATTVTLANGTATLPVPALAVGAHSAVCTYSGDTNFTAAGPVTTAITVAQLSAQVTAATSFSGTSVPVGQPFNVNVAFTLPGGGPVPTGTITYAVDGGTAQSATLVSGAVTFAITGLTAGSHTVAISYAGDSNYGTSGTSLTFTATSTTPLVPTGGLVNGALTTSSISPGALASIFGDNLSTGTAQASALPLQTTLAGATVTINGEASPLLYVSPTQINFQVPYDTALGSATVVISTSAGTGAPFTVTVTAAAPAIFTYVNSAGQINPVILHAATSTLVTAASPAQPGETLTLYATGAGPVNNTPASGAGAGPGATSLVNPTITVGSVTATVGFSGLSQGSVGLFQINFTLPATLPAGTGAPPTLPLTISLPGSSSPAVNLFVSQ
jgi:sugar lactone lactonase YvrE